MMNNLMNKQKSNKALKREEKLEILIRRRAMHKYQLWWNRMHYKYGCKTIKEWLENE